MSPNGRVSRSRFDERQEETKFVVYADTYESQGMIPEHLRKALPRWNVAMTPNGESDNESRFAIYDEFCSSGKQILVACRVILYGIFLDGCNTAVFRDSPRFPHLFVTGSGRARRSEDESLYTGIIFSSSSLQMR
ncbi:hypothetical protein DTO271G3_1402 [Paecilomyces variotii]|nr:hypothetical protein DTO271G3_1402 [Paecilomyces variotii]